MESQKAEAQGNTHRWHLHFDRFAKYTDETEALVRLHIVGLSRIIHWPVFLVDAFYLDEADEQLIRARDEAKYAAPEAERGFPLVHAHALLGLWSALEALVEDAAVAWIVEKPETLQRPEFAKIRVPLAEFALMSAEDQALYLMAEAQRDSKLAQGVTRFERVLELVGLRGNVPEEVRKAIYEAQQVRNSLAHRGGLVDRRLADACPWLALQPGEQLTVPHHKWEYYLHATRLYCVEIINRFRAYENMTEITPPGPPLSSFLNPVPPDEPRVDLGEPPPLVSSGEKDPAGES